VPDRRRVEFAYGYQGRRVSKRVYTWNAGTTSWDLSTDTRFVWDQWNLLAEFGVPASAGPVLARSYLWGLDLEGLKTGAPGQEAGGIGGLVSVTEWSVGGALRAANYYAVADGNGNVALLVAVDSFSGRCRTVLSGGTSPWWTPRSGQYACARTDQSPSAAHPGKP